MVECNIVPVLDSYIHPFRSVENTQLRNQNLTEYEVEELQFQVYTILFALSYNRPLSLIQNQVISHLVCTLQGNDDSKVREQIFQILLNLVHSEEGIQELSTEEFFQICFELVRFGNSLEEKQLILSLLSTICNGRDYNKKLFRECGGVSILLQLLPFVLFSSILLIYSCMQRGNER